ncbi:MAG: ABC transporter substrate-binding protein [Bryobacterales bacterium]|nr:ABC transporter substrate-binding protein [Bryobacterales bacterium]
MRFVVCVALLGALACSSPKTGSEVRIAVGGQSQLVYLPTTLARQLGEYEKYNLRVTLTDFQGGAKALEALLGGSADVVSGFFDHVIQMHAEGRKVRAFVAMQRFPGLAVVVSPATKKQIRTIADLKGAIVGVSAPGSSTDLLLKYLLSRNGVPASEVSFTGIGMSAAAVAAMERGKVDAAVMADPAITILAQRARILRILADTRTEEGVKQVFGTSQYPAAVLYATDAWLSSHPSEALALAKAMQNTLRYLQSNPKEAAAKMPPEFQGDDRALYAETVRAALPMYSPSGEMPADGPATLMKVLGVSLDKVRNARIDPGATYTNQWVTQ